MRVANSFFERELVPAFFAFDDGGRVRRFRRPLIERRPEKRYTGGARHAENLD
jgi:hypothetical protein